MCHQNQAANIPIYTYGHYSTGCQTNTRHLCHERVSNTNVLRNNLRVRSSPIKSPVLRKYLNPFKRPSMYPSISKCNAKSCNCCQHLCTNTTITSSVNGRTFSVINNSDSD